MAITMEEMKHARAMMVEQPSSAALSWQARRHKHAESADEGGMIDESVMMWQEEGYAVRMVVRTKERGLSSAVLYGFAEARGAALVCMDADLQHPPDKVLISNINP
jgi:glycosyltransferase involved in cell wall biosynthesis